MENDKKIKLGQVLRRDSGQAITMMLLFISGIMLSATVIAGLLIVYQVRQAIDAGASARSVFAADAGTEAALYCFYKEMNSSVEVKTCNKIGVFLSSGSVYGVDLSFSKDDGTFTDGLWSDNVAGLRIIARGSSGKTVRFLENTFKF